MVRRGFSVGYGVVGLLAAGGLALLGLRNTWWSTTAKQAGLPPIEVQVTGAAVVPGAVGLAIVVTAAGLGILAGSLLIRRLVGALVAVVGLASAVWVFAADESRALEHGLNNAAVSGAIVTWHHTSWQLVSSLAFLVAAILGLIIVWKAPTWRSMGAKYEAPTRAKTEEPSDFWDALDEGIDPTADDAQ